MYSKPKLAIKYIRYYLTASNGKGHGIHSPFVFNFTINVLNDKRRFYAYDKVETLRKQMLADSRRLEVEDYGAGSVAGKKKQRTVASIARYASKPEKYGQLIFRIVNYFQPQTVVELGTSLGITTAYLALGNESANTITCEGAFSVAKVAQENFSSLELKNIQLIVGHFDDTLPAVLESIAAIDLAFIDGNHRKEPTLHYFQQFLQNIGDNTVLIFDDIHWSREMEEAWQEIKDHPRVLLTIDLFFVGLVFFKVDFKIRQHFSIRF